MLHPDRPTLLARLASNPDDLDARAALYVDLLDAGDTGADGLRVAAGLRDPAAMAALADLGGSPRGSRFGPVLKALKGLPVDHVDVPEAEVEWLDDLAHLPLRSLVLSGPRFACGPDVWRRVPDLRLESLDISTFSRDEDVAGLPSIERLRRLTLRTFGEDFGDRLLQHLAGGVLEHLSLNACDAITDAGLRSLSGLRLKSLTLERAKRITPAGVVHLHGHPLEHLALGWNSKISDDPSCLSGLASLKSLSLDQAYAGDPVLQAIRGLSLERLSLDSSYVTEHGLAALEGMPLRHIELKCPSGLYELDEALDALSGLPLQHLGLGHMRDFDDRGLSRLKGWTLESLDLSLNDVTAKGLKHLAGLPLKVLDLGYNRSVDGKALRVLADLGLPLEALNIGCLDLRDDDLAALRGLPLKRLHLLDSPWLTDAGVAHLQGMPLEHLTIGADAGDAQITSRSVPVLAAMPLKTLWLPNCSRIDEAGWDRLAALPARVDGPGV